MSGDKISIIVAMDPFRTIGNGDQLPWAPRRIKRDMEHFKNLTTGHPVIMGRITYETIIAALGKPLPDRHSIIVTRQKRPIVFDDHPDCTVAASIPLAIEAAHQQTNGKGEIFIAGGGEIYEQTIHIADTIYLTMVGERFQGNIFFPVIPKSNWRLISVEEIPADGNTPFPLRFITAKRKSHLHP